MKIGLSTASLFMRYSNEDALTLMNELGITQAEVFLTSFCEYDPAFAKILKGRQGNVNVHSVHVLNTQFEPQLFNAHPRVKGDAFALLKQTMESAVILGAKYYTFHGTARLKVGSNYDNYPRLSAGYREILDFCKGYGVQLCLENVEWAQYNVPGVFSKLKKLVPDLMGVLDVKQAYRAKRNWEDYLLDMSGSIAHVHVSDVTEDGKMCLPGRGVFDFKKLVHMLRDNGFDGNMFIEVYENDYKEVSELVESVEYLNSLI